MWFWYCKLQLITVQFTMMRCLEQLVSSAGSLKIRWDKKYFWSSRSMSSFKGRFSVFSAFLFSFSWKRVATGSFFIMRSKSWDFKIVYIICLKWLFLFLGRSLNFLVRTFRLTPNFPSQYWIKKFNCERNSLQQA